MLYDHLKPLNENPICHNCSNEMEFKSRSRKEDGTYTVLRYECPTCHTREAITTRNNVRMDNILILGIAIGGWTILVGVLLGLITALKIIATGTP